MRGVGDLGHDRQAGRLMRLVEQFEAFSLEALERIRGGARLPRAAAQHGGAVRLHMARHVDDLLLAFDRAGAGHHDQLFTAHDHARRDLDLGIIRMELAVGQLEWLLHLDNVFHLGVAQQRVLIHRARVADETDDDRTRAVDRVGLDIPTLDVPGKLFNVFAGRTLLHNDNHVFSLLVILGVNCVCPAEKKHKKSLSSTKRDERQTFRGTTHIRHGNHAALFRIHKISYPCNGGVRRRLLQGFFQRRSLRGNFIVPASASVSSHAGHSLKAARGTITFLCHRFVQYL